MPFYSTIYSRAYWLFPLLLGAGLYLINLKGTWIYDDLYFAHDDPRLHDVHQWKNYLREEYFVGSADKIWRPLVSLSFAVEWGVHGERAWPFHLVNLLLHAAVCALVAKLSYRLMESTPVGLIAGLIFAAHPIHVEAVTGIVGRAEEMCAIGVLGAMLLVIDRTMTPRRALAVTACFLFAALSKEQGILLPFMLAWWFATRWWALPSVSIESVERSDHNVPLVVPKPPEHVSTLDYRQKERRGKPARISEPLLILIALLTGTLAAYVSYRNSIAPWFWEKWFLESGMNPLVESAGVDRWLIPVAIFGRYTALLAVPWRLAPDYSAMVFTSVQSIGDPYLWIGTLTLLLFTAAFVFAMVRKNSILLFMLGCLAITYFLAGNIVLIGTIFGERLMYLPSVFACILVAGWLKHWPGKPRAAFVGLLLLAYCVRTETYAWQWNDRVGFYRYAVRVQPRSSMVYLLLGDELLHRQGNPEEAERVFAEGRAIVPGAWRLLKESAELALQRGHYVDAEIWARRAMKLHPGMETSQLLMDTVQAAATQPSSH